VKRSHFEHFGCVYYDRIGSPIFVQIGLYSSKTTLYSGTLFLRHGVLESVMETFAHLLQESVLNKSGSFVRDLRCEFAEK